MSFGLLWAANALLPGTVFSFMLVLFPRIIAVGISMRTLIGRNEAQPYPGSAAQSAPTGAADHDRGGDFPLLPRSVGRHEVAAANPSAPGGAFVTPWQKLRALPSYIEILTVPMALRVIRIAETAVRLRRNTGHRLNPPQKQLICPLRFSAWDAVFCVLLAASIAAGLYPVIAVSATFNHIPFKKESLTMSTANPNKLKSRTSSPLSCWL